MSASDDEAQPCAGHVWAMKNLHLSLRRGAEVEEQCSRCGAVRYATDDVRPSWD